MIIQSDIRLQIRASICAIQTFDAVATGEVSCYTFLFDSALFLGLRRRLAKGAVGQRNDHLPC